jgi:DnaA family protein
MSAGGERWRQLTLGLFRDVGAGFDNYHPAGNDEALSALAQWAHGAGPWCMLLWGGCGVGKSHLLQAAVRAAAERGAQAMYVPLAEALGYGVEALDGLDTLAALALDDLEVVTGRRAWEEALFALYNRMQAVGGRLLVSAAAAPRELPFALSDLRSRFAAALVYRLKPLSDDERRAALVAAAAGRGIHLPEPVASYLLRRVPRDWSALQAALARLDGASLSAGRSLTVPFVREVLRLED